MSNVSCLSCLLGRCIFHRSNALISNVVNNLCDDATAVSVLTHGYGQVRTRRVPRCMSTVVLTIDVVFLHFVVLVLVFDASVFLGVCPCLLVVSTATTNVNVFVRGGRAVGNRHRIVRRARARDGPLRFGITLVFTLLFMMFAFLARCALICTKAKNLDVLSVTAKLDSVAPFVLGLLRNKGVPTAVMKTYVVRTVVDGVMIGVFCTVFFSSHEGRVLPCM